MTYHDILLDEVSDVRMLLIFRDELFSVIGGLAKDEGHIVIENLYIRDLHFILT